jgi:hypothetical protein
MAQELNVKVKLPDGTTTMKKLFVIRGWQESSGKQLFLFADGAYGFKDGSPVRSVSDFDMIANQQQKRAALFWWEKIGKELSARFYADQEARAAELAGVYQFEPQGSESDLDSVLYIRKPAKKGKGAVSDPHPWMKWFQRRPEWWGQATVIGFADYTYEMATPDGAAKEDAGNTKEVKEQEEADTSGRGSMPMPDKDGKKGAGAAASF